MREYITADAIACVHHLLGQTTSFPWLSRPFTTIGWSALLEECAFRAIGGGTRALSHLSEHRIPSSAAARPSTAFAPLSLIGRVHATEVIIDCGSRRARVLTRDCAAIVNGAEIRVEYANELAWTRACLVYEGHARLKHRSNKCFKVA